MGEALVAVAKFSMDIHTEDHEDPTKIDVAIQIKDTGRICEAPL